MRKKFEEKYEAKHTNKQIYEAGTASVGRNRSRIAKSVTQQQIETQCCGAGA
jgi:uncharacterized metal-binding protein